MAYPRYKRYLRQALPFAFIWLIFGLVYVFLEYGLLGRLQEYPATRNRYDFKNSLIYIGSGSFIMGLVQGWIEVSWLRKQFEKRALWVKLLCKGLFYLALIVLFLILLAWIINMRRFDAGLFDKVVLESLPQFFLNFAFWSNVLYVAATLGIALFFSEIGQYLGIGVFYNFILGKYHKPRKETRIFMFLDMRSSTTIAEQMGHEQYFELLKSYYADMTDAILSSAGEIYQYVGDEIVISWQLRKGQLANSCLHCLRDIGRQLQGKAGYYRERFGVLPSFKAGFHIGEVTVGEIGIIKKDIIYTGDVLNTTSRIQAQCAVYGATALLSGDLLPHLNQEQDLPINRIGALRLRGKAQEVELYELQIEAGC